MPQPTLFDLPTTELLERFGAGNATPGSGCAAALMALLSAKLITAVARMTASRPTATGSLEEAGLIVSILDSRISPRLKELFDQDAEVFDSVIEARKLRDSSTVESEKRKHTAIASDKLREATDVLLEIVALSFEIKDFGLAIWNRGFRPAMGDAGAGISASIAAITTCILVANLNLRSARSTWAKESKIHWDEVSARLLSAQAELLEMVQASNARTTDRLLT